MVLFVEPCVRAALLPFLGHPAGAARQRRECRDRGAMRDAGIAVGTPIPTLAPPAALLRDDQGREAAPAADAMQDQRRFDVPRMRSMSEHAEHARIVETVSPPTYHVYILANRSRHIYIGVTRDLRRRAWQHEHGCVPGFTKRYAITILVYAEPFADIRAAIAREKQLKRWPRWRKDRLIDAVNPEWADIRVDRDASNAG